MEADEELCRAWFRRMRENFYRAHPNATDEELFLHFVDEVISNPAMARMMAESGLRRWYPELAFQPLQMTAQ